MARGSRQRGDSYWVDAQNALTAGALAGPLRELLVRRLTDLHDYPRTSAPLKRQNRYFLLHNAGLQNQPVLFVHEAGALAPRALLDPNALSADGTVALTALAPNDQGTLVAYGLSAGGSDRQDIRIRDVVTGEDLPDRILWTKFVSIAWVPDGSGFYYTRFPAPGSVPEADENYFCSVWFHRLGDPQTQDALVFETPDQPETVFEVDVAHGGRWVVITAQKGASDRSEVYLIDRHSASAAPVKVFAGFDAAFSVLDAAAGLLFFRTDRQAPRGRIVALDPENLEAGIREVVPEQQDKLSLALIAGGRIVASYLRNASDRLQIFELSGVPVAEIGLPALGSLTGLEGDPDDSELLVGFTSFVLPPTNFHCDLAAPRAGPLQCGPAGCQTYRRRPRHVRDYAGLVHVERRNARVDVPGASKRPASGWRAARSDHRIWRVQHLADARVRSGDVRVARAWRHLCASRIFAAAANTANPGTKPGCSVASRTSSTTSSPQPNGSCIHGWSRPGRIAIEGGSNGGLLIGGGHDPAARPVRRRRLPRAGRRHAALSPVYRRPVLDSRVRIGRQPGTVRVPLSHTRRTTTCATTCVSADADYHGRHRRPRRRRGWPRSSPRGCRPRRATASRC